MKRRIIYPVIFHVPENERDFRGRDKTIALSWHARQALLLSAQKSDLPLGNLPKDPDGVPLPIHGTYWSITHKSDYVGGVVSRTKIGMDIEKFRTCSPALFKKTAKDAEWALGHEDLQQMFFRYWTAKEAVLKASGTGISDLLQCRVVQVIDKSHLTCEYQGQQWTVEHLLFDGHIASVVQNDDQVQWTVL